MPAYEPTGPYILQSGPKKGLSIEQLMFSNYEWLVFMKNFLNEKSPDAKNQLHKHIEWVLGQGSRRSPTMICPQCGKRPVSYFSYLGSEQFGYSMGATYTCCNDEDCIHRLSTRGIEKKPAFLSIDHSSIIHFKSKRDQKKVVDILKKCYELPKRLTKETLFAFFNK
ncbi:MAG: hypothetical protein WC819_03470 [Parcubacteria group bacterium]|jgi:hypothetical protein